ncbi:sensor histidine kinase [Actinomadura rudentiformis]|uniref:histidine kinase n=1 Tax=Actinomadura rudentiformis TaxID=359158 RepID=A0A6H9YE65_9ACTN|nr:sensor histidine kinase [Actinomadura rudentiformis]KAB2342655.1 sensor histidine kinase [Actinomadura rudentiformis]
MSIIERARALPQRGVDALITIVCSVQILMQAAVDEQLEWWVPLLVSVYALPLMWRRQYPFAVTFICGVGTSLISPTELLGQFPSVQLVATYTFAELCPPVKRALSVVGTVIGVTASIVIPKDEALNLGLVGIGFAVAYALGTGARARRDRITMLEERARRLAEEQDAAATRERERIAREMHDIIAHSMSMIAIQAEGGSAVVHRDPAKAEQVFETISVTSREALAQLRRALGVLRSEGAARRPQPDLGALPALVDRVRKTGLTVTLEEAGEPRPVPPDLGTTAYRIVQESLTNTVKHAEAGSVLVRVGWEQGTLRLEVCDDGRGPGDGSGDSGGHGLTGMRERAAAAGGELTFGPAKGGSGFRVKASFPLN